MKDKAYDLVANTGRYQSVFEPGLLGRASACFHIVMSEGAYYAGIQFSDDVHVHPAWSAPLSSFGAAYYSAQNMMQQWRNPSCRNDLYGDVLDVSPAALSRLRVGSRFFAAPADSDLGDLLRTEPGKLEWFEVVSAVRGRIFADLTFSETPSDPDFVGFEVNVQNGALGAGDSYRRIVAFDHGPSLGPYQCWIAMSRLNNAFSKNSMYSKPMGQGERVFIADMSLPKPTRELAEIVDNCDRGYKAICLSDSSAHGAILEFDLNGNGFENSYAVIERDCGIRYAAEEANQATDAAGHAGSDQWGGDACESKFHLQSNWMGVSPPKIEYNINPRAIAMLDSGDMFVDSNHDVLCVSKSNSLVISAAVAGRPRGVERFFSRDGIEIVPGNEVSGSAIQVAIPSGQSLVSAAQAIKDVQALKAMGGFTSEPPYDTDISTLSKAIRGDTFLLGSEGVPSVVAHVISKSGGMLMLRCDDAVVTLDVDTGINLDIVSELDFVAKANYQLNSLVRDHLAGFAKAEGCIESANNPMTALGAALAIQLANVTEHSGPSSLSFSYQVDAEDLQDSESAKAECAVAIDLALEELSYSVSTQVGTVSEVYSLRSNASVEVLREAGANAQYGNRIAKASDLLDSALQQQKPRARGMSC